MTFWTVFTVFVLLPLLILNLVFFLRPVWLPLVIPMSTLSALAIYWSEFCYFEWRPSLMILLSIQMIAVTTLVLGLAMVRKTPNYGAFFLESLSAFMFTAMCICISFTYIELKWLARLDLPYPQPQVAFLLLIPFGAGIGLSLWFSRRLHRNP